MKIHPYRSFVKTCLWSGIRAIIYNAMKTYAPWGKSLSISLFNCNHKTLTSPRAIKTFVKTITKKIHMKAHGPCYIERFGSGKLEGYSAMQFIETSTVVVHCDDVGNRAFIDVFSCKTFDEKKAKAFAVNYFQAQSAKAVTLDR